MSSQERRFCLLFEVSTEFDIDDRSLPPLVLSFRALRCCTVAYLRRPLYTTPVVLRVDPLVQVGAAVEGGVPRKEGGVVDCYRADYLERESRQGGGRLGQLPSREQEVQYLARWKATLIGMVVFVRSCWWVYRWKTGGAAGGADGWLYPPRFAAGDSAGYKCRVFLATTGSRKAGVSDAPMLTQGERKPARYIRLHL